MGGFMIYEPNSHKAHHTVMPEELDELLRNGEIRITEAEIRDKGRSDALSKGLVLVQTTWFILQCIVCWVEHLPIMELEIMTLGFAAMNFVMYAVWWNKPQNGECPVRVYKKKQVRKDKDQAQSESQVNAGEQTQGQQMVGKSDGQGDETQGPG